MHAKVSPIPSVDPRQAELIERVARAVPREGLHATSVAPLSLIRFDSCSPQLPSVYDPCLCFVVQGRKRALLGDEIYVYDPLHYLVVSMTLPVIGQIIEASPERPYLCMRISIDTKMLGELLLEAGPTLAIERVADRALYIARTGDALLDAIVRLMRLFDHPRDAVVLAPLVLREIHYRVLLGELGQRLRELCRLESQTQRIARAIELLRARYTQSVSIDDLARVAHMSASSLHHRFKEVTAMSPVQYQKHLRLHEARRLMLLEGLEAASAAHRVGYESPSQFSREYRRLFGAPPKREIDAVRSV
jgi:AraC-like DNA-binding protein